MAVKLNDVTFEYTYFKGEIIKSTEAVVPIMSHSLQYGMGVFAGIRGFVSENGYKIFRLEDHYKRFMNATKILGLPISFTWEEFSSIIEELVRKNAPTGNFYMRPFIFSDTDQISPVIDKCNYSLSVYMLTMNEYYNTNGLNLCISSYQKYHDNAISTKAKVTGGYVNSLLAKNEAYLNGYDDAVLLDSNGYLAEMSAGNILVVYNDKVLVPFIGSSVLEGITMRSVIEILKDNGYTVVESQIDRSTVYAASEVIALGTAVKVKNVRSIDKRIIGNSEEAGPVCKFLQGEFDSILADNNKKSEKWLYKFSK